MPTLTVTKTYSDGNVLNESDLDAIKSSIETFVNTTKLDADNIQDSAISTVKINNSAVTSAKIAGGAVTSAKIGSNAVTEDKTANRLVSSVSGATTITDSDNVGTLLVTTGSTNRTITLPTASGNTKRRINIKKADSGTGAVVIDGESSETIDGEVTLSLTSQYQTVTLESDGSNWSTITNTPNRYRIKTLGASLTNSDNGDVSDLTFSNMEQGKTYKITMNLDASVAAGDNVLLYAYDGTSGGGNLFLQATGGDPSGTGTANQGHCVTAYHTMATSTLTISATSIGGGSQIIGDGSTQRTFVMVEESTNPTEYTGWD